MTRWLIRFSVWILLPFLIAGLVIIILPHAYLQSSPILLLSVAPTPAYVCKAHEGDLVVAEFTILNMSKETITLLGANSSCGCTTVQEEFPIEVVSGMKQKVHVQVSIGKPDANGRFKNALKLLVNRRGTVPLLIVEAEISKS